MDCLLEQAGWEGRDREKLGRAGHAGGIGGGTEDGDAVGGCAVGAEAFEGLEAVVQAGTEAVDGDIGGSDEAGGGPASAGGGVGAFDVADHCYD